MRKIFITIAKYLGFAAVAFVGLGLLSGVYIFFEFQDIAYDNEAIAKAKDKNIFVFDNKRTE